MVRGEPVSVDTKHYYTAAELAELALPGLSKAKRKINERAEKERWALRTDESGAPLARRRSGRGGGLEYHAQLLPAAARLELAKRGLLPPENGTEAHPELDPSPARAGSWAWLEGQSSAVKAEAERRLRTVDRVDACERSNLTRSAAVACAAAEAGIATSTLWGWLDLIDGVDRADRLPHLAPRRKGGGAEADVDDRAWRFLLSDYLRSEEPTWTSCYRRASDYAAALGLVLPHSKTLFRKLEREIDPRLVIAKRKGQDALRGTLPPQQRTVADLVAMQLMNIDGHKFDVFCRWPDGRVGRPLMVAIQDVYSRKILAWRIDESESALSTRLVFADLFRNFGIPGACVLDNGRAFASKWITGGAKTRFRFKIRAEEPTGILTALGIRTHWTFPFRGQSKPIERAFRDLAEAVKDPRLAGAWTGNHIDNKPENYGSRSVPIETFTAIMDSLIRAHNARRGRRTETAHGQSFDEVFEASYGRHAIGRATEEQLRLALLAADELSTDRQSGAITLMGNRYWSPEMSALAGQKVTVRFDPDDLTLPVYVYDINARFLAAVPLLEQTGFLDAAAAQRRARQERTLKKTVRQLEEIEGLMAAEQLAELMPIADDAPIEMPSPSVIRPVRHRGMTAAAARAVPEQAAPSFIDRFDAGFRRLRAVE